MKPELYLSTTNTKYLDEDKSVRYSCYVRRSKPRTEVFWEVQVLRDQFPRHVTQPTSSTSMVNREPGVFRSQSDFSITGTSEMPGKLQIKCTGTWQLPSGNDQLHKMMDITVRCEYNIYGKKNHRGILI